LFPIVNSPSFSAQAVLPVLETNLAMTQNQIFLTQDLLRQSLNTDKHLLDFLV
jgi:hypothetical protein